jgi:hypothetical protein
VARRPRTAQREHRTTPPISSTGAYKGAPASAASIAGSSLAGLAFIPSRCGHQLPSRTETKPAYPAMARFAEEHRKIDCMPGVP